MSGVMVELAGVTAGYGAHEVLCNVSASLHSGELVTLIGANGAGKSTLLKVMSGDIAALNGTVNIVGEPVAEIPQKRLCRMIAVVNTDRVEVEALTVEEVVGMGRYPYTGFFGSLGSDDREIVRGALADTGMEAFSGRYISSLSDGERQKVMIARALAQQTAVIFLDEPTAFLDVASRVEVLTLLRDLARKHRKAILLSSHDIASALELSDRVWLLPGDGTLRAETPADLIAAHVAHEEGNPLDLLFAGRGVRFDARRLDYVGITH